MFSKAAFPSEDLMKRKAKTKNDKLNGPYSNFFCQTLRGNSSHLIDMYIGNCFVSVYLNSFIYIVSDSCIFQTTFEFTSSKLLLLLYMVAKIGNVIVVELYTFYLTQWNDPFFVSSVACFTIYYLPLIAASSAKTRQRFD